MTHRPETGTDDGREIEIRRVFDAPRSLVFAAFTDRGALARWWGPRGFATTTHAMEVRPGGAWVYVMHGPDGTDYENWIVYREVVPPERLVYDHGGGARDTPAHFHVVVTFAERDGRTEVVMRSRFPSREARDEVVRRYGAIQGGQETLARLAEHLAAQAPAGERRHFWFARAFPAPRPLVWSAWTDPRRLARWWGPHGFTTARCEFDARAGGALRIDMKSPDGTVFPMTGEVLEATAPERLVFITRPLDAQGRAMFVVRNAVSFIEQAGHTTVMVEATVLEATPGAAQHLAGMEIGWNMTLDRLIAEVAPGAAADHASATGGPQRTPPDREIVSTRVVRFPRARVVRAWTDPERLKRWWGPKGFTNTFREFDQRPGGQWRFTMHGPDGVDHDNHSVFVEVAPPERIVFDHVTPPLFRVTATFAERDGGTEIVFRMRFSSVEDCARLRGFIAPANEENFDRMEAVLRAEG